MAPSPKPVPATLQDWLIANQQTLGVSKSRSWSSHSHTSSFAASKPSQLWTVRLKQGGKTVSVGTGPKKDIAIRDALDNLPSTWR